MKKYADTVELYNTIRQKLKDILSEIAMVNYPECDEKWYVPCTLDRYLLYTIKHNKYNYCYFYHLESRDQDFCIETDTPILGGNGSVFSCTIFQSAKVGKPKKVLIHDILVLNGKVLKVDYLLRYNLLIEKIGTTSIKVTNNYKFQVSPKLTGDTDLDVFKTNFKYPLSHFLCVWNSYHKDLYLLESNYIMQNLVIKPQIKSEIYNVYSMTTNEDLGLLYIKSLSDSRYIRSLFKNVSDTHIIHKCIYNERFGKWEITKT